MVFYSLTMQSSLLLSILGLSATLQHCPMWKEITPCNCRLDSSKLTTLTCENMNSYEQVVNLLRGHFSPADRVSLRVGSSNLNDLQYRSLKELNMSIENLKLNHDYIGPLDDETFDGLTKVTYLSLADNNLEVIPEGLWRKMPNIKTLDLGRTKIRHISETSFLGLSYLECLVLPGNQITRMDTNTIPVQVQKLHLGRNYIRDLNGTLRNLSNLGWLFINSNELTDLEDQLPIDAPNLILIHASHNSIERLPQQLKTFPLLQSLFFQNNRLKSLDGTLSKSRNLQRLVLEHNQINRLTEEDFAEAEMLVSILLNNNEITSLNNSLLNLKNLNFINMSYNFLSEFSFQDIVGLESLKSIDLSYNHITTIKGPAANLVEWNIKLNEIKLEHNNLETLNGALSGLPELLRLDLSFNRLTKISPDDLIGLDQLRLLDISHNHLTTLEETSKTFLPKLSELKASHNYLTILERDFHGLPVLCHADLSNNQIVALGRDLVTKTRCKVENEVHEGTWDTLKMYLQDNPILCDAALQEIMSEMEINHTRIYGVSHCPPLSEQPVTNKPNAFLGYVPEETPTQATISANRVSSQVQIQTHTHSTSLNDPNIQHNKLPYPEKNREPVVELRTHNQYTIENDQPVMNTPAKPVLHNIEKPIALNLQIPHDLNRVNSGSKGHNENIQLSRPQIKIATLNDDSSLEKAHEAQVDIKTKAFDPVQQGQQITKLASEIEELRSRIDQLSSQNQMLLNQQFNKSILTEQTSSLTAKPPNENLTEPRKP